MGWPHRSTQRFTRFRCFICRCLEIYAQLSALLVTVTAATVEWNRHTQVMRTCAWFMKPLGAGANAANRRHRRQRSVERVWTQTRTERRCTVVTTYSRRPAICIYRYTSVKRIQNSRTEWPELYACRATWLTKLLLKFQRFYFSKWLKKYIVYMPDLYQVQQQDCSWLSQVH